MHLTDDITLESGEYIKDIKENFETEKVTQPH